MSTSSTELEFLNEGATAGTCLTSLIIDLMKILHGSVFPKGIGIGSNGRATFFNSLPQNSNGLVMNSCRFFCRQSLGRSSWMNLSSPEDLIYIDIAKASYQGLV